MPRLTAIPFETAPLILAMSLICFVTMGCGGPGGPPLVEVKGTATYDGVPIADGAITLIPEGDTGRPDGGKIDKGNFSLKATLGPKKVQITANRESDEASPYGGKLMTQFIPEKFNDKSTLTIDIKPGMAPVKFDLVSK